MRNTRTACIVVNDEVNCFISGLDVKTKSILKKKFSYFVPGAQFQQKYKLGWWDGYVSMFRDGWLELELIDDEVIDILEDAGYTVEFDDRRQPWPVEVDLSPIDRNTFSEFLGKDGKPIVLRDHQVESSNILFQHNSGMAIMGTGAGKSYTCAAIAKRFMDYGKVLVIVPSINLVMQTAAEFRRLGVETGEFNGERKDVQNVTITTWQSLQNYPELFDGVVCVLVDEAHGAKGPVLRKLLGEAGRNVPYRYGFTGTLPDDELGEIQVISQLGPVRFIKESWELQKEGTLAQSNIHCLVLDEGKTKFSDYDSERTWLGSDLTRMKHVAETISELAKSGNTFVMVNNKEPGKLLAKLIGPMAVYVDGDVKAKKRKVEFDSLSETDNRIIISTKHISSTGLDMPRIFNLVLFECGKSMIQIIQSIGRALRKADDKSIANIYDISATTKHSTNHRKKRQAHYDRYKYAYKTVMVKYR